MKTITLSTLILIAASGIAQGNQPRLYIHGFRAPSTGMEYRTGNVGFHAGLYTTILDARNKSTEFIKVGGTYYYRLSNNERMKRFESYVSAAFVRGLNRNYDNKNGGFFESGFLYELGKGFEIRIGTGVLVAKGFKPEVNPTIGISYSVPIR